MYVVSLYGIEMNEFNAARMILNAAVSRKNFKKYIFFTFGVKLSFSIFIFCEKKKIRNNATKIFRL